MLVRWLTAVALLPGTVLVAVPAAILYGCRDTAWRHAWATPATPQFWIALPSAVVGLVLGAWTATLFVRFGDGTAAPWDPPARFVVRGPYRHVRNPMITGVIAMLLAEALVLRSWPILVWACVFVAGNAIYIPGVEEPGLRKRFGESYLDYKRHVPRWVPRLTPWRGKDGDG